MRSAIGTVWGMDQVKGKSIALQQLRRVARTMSQCAVFLVSYLWPPYVIWQAITFLPCDFFYLSSFFFSSPILNCHRLDVYHTSTHGVDLVRILRCRSETCCTRLAKSTGRKKSPSRHRHTTLSGYIFTTKARIDNRKKIVRQQYLPHVITIW